MCVSRMKKSRLNRFFDRCDLTVAPRISPDLLIEASSRKKRVRVYEKNQS